MLVFVDESGDTGFKFGLGSSDHFAVSAVLFRDRSIAEQCDRAIDQLRVDLGWHPRREFHFHKLDDPTRLRFLSVVASFDYSTVSFVLNKPALFEGALRHKERLYTKVMSWVFDNAAPRLEHATVVVDRSGSREFREELGRFLKQWTNTTKHPNAIKKIRHERSHTNNLLQLADMTVSSLARCYRSPMKDHSFWAVVQHRSISLRFWP